LLWVSADPGCGKSVLAKYLADEVLPSTTTRATCYFFFKEDFEDQRSSIVALCSMLRQIFDQDPVSFSTEILQTLEEKGPMLLKSFHDLWDILISAATGSKREEIVCIFDALDECEASGRRQLIEAISKFYSGKPTRSVLKVILT
jgi:predicted NACHT family NTPase